MKFQLKILAVLFLFLGYSLLLFVIFGLWTFWGYWQQHSSLTSDFASFQRNYNDYFSEYDLSPLKTFLIAGLYVFLGHGLLKLKWWAGYATFILCLINLFFFLEAAFSGYFKTVYFVEIALAVYALIVLFGNKEIFRENKTELPDQKSTFAEREKQ